MRQQWNYFFWKDFLLCNYYLFFWLQCDSPYIITFFSAFFVENRISICTEFMDGEFSLHANTQSCCFFCQPKLRSRALWDLPHVSLSSNHLHFCRSTKCPTAMCCVASLCAKSYRGVINSDLSAHVFKFECPHVCCSNSHVSHIWQLVILNSLNFIKLILCSDFQLVMIIVVEWMTTEMARLRDW